MALQSTSTSCNECMPGLLGLPLELRNHIYRYLIPTKRVVDAAIPWVRFRIPHNGTTDSNISDSNNGEDDFENHEYGVHEADHAPQNLETRVNDLALSERDDHASEDDRVKGIQSKETFDDGADTYSTYDFDDDTYPWETNRKNNSVFLVCKQVSNEALDILYGENIFQQYLHFYGGLHLEENFTEANRRRLRVLLLTSEYRCRSAELIPDNSMWASIIPTLNVLRLVVKQPTQQTYYNATPIEEDMENWFTFLRTFLGCFRQHLPEGKLLEVDFDNKLETGEVIKECMPGVYREVRCKLAGDFMFRRGRFSEESGYWGEEEYTFGSWDA